MRRIASDHAGCGDEHEVLRVVACVLRCAGRLFTHITVLLVRANVRACRRQSCAGIEERRGAALHAGEADCVEAIGHRHVIELRGAEEREIVVVADVGRECLIGRDR